MTDPRNHPGEGPIPADSYAAWWAQAHVADDPEVQQLREQFDEQCAEIEGAGE